MATAFLRTLILYFLIIIGLRLMGKRQVGELEPSELVTAILISDLSAVPMQDLGIPLVQGVIPIITLFSLELILSAIAARSVRARGAIYGSSSVLIKGGRVNQAELKRLRINIAELMEELRIKDVFDIRKVSSAFLETNGQLSLQLKPGEQPATAAQMQIATDSEAELHTTLIAHGRILTKNLRSVGRDPRWLEAQIKNSKISGPDEVFLMLIDNLGQVLLIKNEERDTMSARKEG